MVKKQVNFRASDLTREQLDQLQEWWGATQSEVITVAVDRACREELARRGGERADAIDRGPGIPDPA